MSKEIKFKVWDKVKNEMCEVMGIDFIQNIILCFPITKRTARAGKWRSMDEFELMQFTGLHDKSGKEIYTGDLVHSWGGECCQSIWEYDVVVEVKMCGACLLELENSENLEIIGTKWDNPELEAKK